MSTYKVKVGSDTLMIELGMPETQIRVDDTPTGIQSAGRTDDLLKAAVRWAYDMPVFETEEEAEAAGFGPNRCTIWDDVEYSLIVNEES